MKKLIITLSIIIFPALIFCHSGITNNKKQKTGSSSASYNSNSNKGSSAKNFDRKATSSINSYHAQKSSTPKNYGKKAPYKTPLNTNKGTIKSSEPNFYTPNLSLSNNKYSKSKSVNSL